MNIQAVLFGVLNGLWSGIPSCCITHYARCRWAGISDVAYHTDRQRGIPVEVIKTPDGVQALRYPDGETSPGYVQCDACHRHGRTVSIRDNGMIAEWLLKF